MSAFPVDMPISVAPSEAGGRASSPSADAGPASFNGHLQRARTPVTDTADEAPLQPTQPLQESAKDSGTKPFAPVDENRDESDDTSQFDEPGVPRTGDLTEENPAQIAAQLLVAPAPVPVASTESALAAQHDIESDTPLDPKARSSTVSPPTRVEKTIAVEPIAVSAVKLPPKSAKSTATHRSQRAEPGSPEIDVPQPSESAGESSELSHLRTATGSADSMGSKGAEATLARPQSAPASAAPSARLAIANLEPASSHAVPPAAAPALPNSPMSGRGERASTDEPATTAIGADGPSQLPPQAPPQAQSMPLSASPDLPGVSNSQLSNSTALVGGNVHEVDRIRFVQRVARAVQSAAERGGEIRLRLSPPELGVLRLEMIVQDGAMHARLEAETSSARGILMDNLPALRERLAEHHIRIDRFEVHVRDGSDGSLPDRTTGQGDAGSHRGAGARGKSRRVDPSQSIGTPQTFTPHVFGQGQLNVIV